MKALLPVQLHVCALSGILLTLPAAAEDTLTIHFLHGSRPARGHRHTESRWFGGIHGGHVYLQSGDRLFSFYPAGSFHVFARKKQLHGRYVEESLADWRADTPGMKITSVSIVLDSCHHQCLLAVRDHYLAQSPYDYALFGMRCASAAADVLGKAGVLRPRSHLWLVTRYFYPQPLRRKMLRMAGRKAWLVRKQPGRPGRKWEND